MLRRGRDAETRVATITLIGGSNVKRSRRALFPAAILGIAFSLALNANVASADPVETSPPTTQPENGADIKGTGGGKTTLGLVSFDMSAHVRPGDDVLGFGHIGMKVETATDTIEIYVDIDCVNVGQFDPNGRRGVITGVIRRIDPAPNTLLFSVGDRLAFGIDDDGEPSLGSVDDFFFQRDFFFPTFTCRQLIYNGELNNVEQGNITIKLG